MTKRVLCALLGVAGLWLVACSGDRVATHVERADQLQAEGHFKEAILELRSAAALAPNDADLALRVAAASSALGYLGDAIDFYREVHVMRPDDREVGLALAKLLLLEEEDEAREIIDELLTADPQDSDAILLRAEAEVMAGNVSKAMVDVNRAKRIDPDNPEVHWATARVHEAKIAAIRAKPGRHVHSPTTFQAALDAYAKYWEAGGERKVMALYARAKLLMGWPGHIEEASEAFMIALKRAAAEGTIGQQVEISRAAYRFGVASKQDQVARHALKTRLRVEPDNLEVWDSFARLQRMPDKQEAVYQRMLMRMPDDAAAHVVYARYISDTRGVGAAISHLRDQIEAGLDEPILLTGIANIQFNAGRPGDAKRTVDELVEKHPELPSTVVLNARQLLRDGDRDAAIEMLKKLVDEHESPDALRLLARTQYKRGAYEEAHESVVRALKLSRGSDPEAKKLMARILFAQGRHKDAIAVLKRLQRSQGLEEPELLLLARIHYESHGAPFGRRILTDLLEADPGNVRVALDLARREGQNPLQRGVAREHLGAAFARHPKNVEVLEALTELELLDGRSELAISRLNQVIMLQPNRAEPHLLRARTLFTLGHAEAARQDAERALQLSAGVADEAIELLAILYAGSEDVASTIATLEAEHAAGRLTPDILVLLARLKLQQGDDEAALALYEEALAAGSRLVLLKTDLAYLLAEKGRDLERAATLAREAADAPGEQLAAADTLGYVYLKAGQFDAAFWQFRFVTSTADPPVADYYYHLGLALAKLERRNEARAALKRALSINPEFASAEAARDQLVLLSSRAEGGAPGGPGDPS